ncbi:MAG: AGE family epimerase/isomerase [Xanthomonadales bacterium]|nr:AGE family epimerase/isomerase [Xanthomonadales bacterium]
MKDQVKKLAKVSGRLDAWMHDHALPLWWKASRLENGAFFEALDFSGQPVPDRIARVRVQARQIYGFALAWKLGWRKKSMPRKLEKSIRRYLDTCLGPEGIPGTLVNIENGELTDRRPSLYNSAFAVMALAQSRQVLGGKNIDPALDRLLETIDRQLAHPDGNGYRETLPPNTIRLQNPHMHLFESFLCLYRATRDPDVLERAETLLGFIRDTFFDECSGVVQEKANPALEMSTSQYEPGHSMEWVWLLGWRSRLFKLPLDPFATRLYEHYNSAGIAEGATPMCLTVQQKAVDPTRRLWSQTESLKAHLTMAELGPAKRAPGALGRALECAHVIEKDWLDTDCKGGWYDHFDEDGELIATDMPASMGYHLYVLVKELSRSVKKLNKRSFSG